MGIRPGNIAGHNLDGFGSGVATGATFLAQRWAQTVVANGGTVSAARLAIVITMIDSLQLGGCWSLLDDLWMLMAENEPAALTSWKQLRLATVGGGAPAFTIDRGYAFNGTTDFLDTGFVPKTHCAVATASNCRIGVYVRTNVSAAASGMGANDANAGAGINITIIARNGTIATGAANTSGGGTFTLPASDSRGYTAASRNGSTAGDLVAYKNATAMAQATPPTNFGALLPNISVYIGALHNNAGATSFRADTKGELDIGAQLSATQETAQYNAIQAYATAVGGQV